MLAESEIIPLRPGFRSEVLDLIVGVQRDEFGIDITAGQQPALNEIPGSSKRPQGTEIDRMKALWNGQVIAESDDTIVVEGNHYFPPDSLRREFFVPSAQKTVCSWKGEASYYDVRVDGRVNAGAAWYYPTPKSAAAQIAGRVAFWHGVVVER